jgi:hypothetical protein
LGDRVRLDELARAAGITDAEVRTIESPVRFPSIDALVHTEIKASPIRDLIDGASFDALLEAARGALAPFCAGGREVSFGLPVHVLLGRKG